MDSVLFNAMKRREEIRQELSDIERFLRMYNRFKGAEGSPQRAFKLDEPEREHGEEQKESIADQSDTPTAPAAQKRGYTKEMLRPHLLAVIEAAGRPLTRSQLLKELDARNIPVGGSNRTKNMGTIMWRLGGDFVSLEGFGYWPRHRPYPPAGYDPDDLNSPEAIEHTLRTTEPSIEDTLG